MLSGPHQCQHLVGGLRYRYITLSILELPAMDSPVALLLVLQRYRSTDGAGCWMTETVGDTPTLWLKVAVVIAAAVPLPEHVIITD